jgi:uncharacterized protein YndB with AHSA1/START domain
MVACAPFPNDGAVEYISMDAEVVIERPIEAVFAVAGDPSKEHLWRDEVAAFGADGPPAVGTLLTERIDFGVVSGYFTPAFYTDYDPPYFFRVASPPEHPRRLVSWRRFTALGPERTRLEYRALVDRRIARDLVPLPVAPGLAERVYEFVMRGYLRRLKRLLEDAAR